MVSFGIFQAVFLVVGVEVPTRRFEIWTITLCRLVHVDRVIAWRQVLQIKVEGDAVALGFFERDGACAFAFGVLEFNSLLVRSKQKKKL